MNEPLNLKNAGVLKLEEMNFKPEQVAQIKQLAKFKGGGLIVVAGKNGSGKTTTIQNILREFGARQIQLVELHDFIEYPSNNLQITIDDKTQNLDKLYADITKIYDIIVRDHLRTELIDLEKEAELTRHGCLIVGDFHADSVGDLKARLERLTSDTRGAIKMAIYCSYSPQNAHNFDSEIIINSIN